MLQNVYISSLIDYVYRNRPTVVYKVIGSAINPFNDNFICIYYLGILQHKLYAYDNRFEKLSSMICLG